MDDVLHVFSEADAAADIIGVGITEHLLWDAINLKNMLAQLPQLKPRDR